MIFLKEYAKPLMTLINGSNCFIAIITPCPALSCVGFYFFNCLRPPNM
jgi:hypothetical protein